MVHHPEARVMPTKDHNIISRPERLWRLAAQLLIGLGIAVRVAVWWQQRPIFIDEANLIRNFVERSYTGLFSNLDYAQYAPPLFSVIMKASIDIWGNQELSTRFFPLVSSVAMLALFYRLARRWITPLACLLAVGFMSFDKIFIDYATECKQYATDGAVALALIEFTQHLGKNAFGWREARWWALIGAVAIWLSMPAVFILVGVGLFYLGRYYQRRDYLAVGRIALVGGWWVLNFGAYFVLLLKQNVQSDYLQKFHHENFLVFPPRSLAELGLLGKQLNGIVDKAIGKTVVASVLAAIGFVWGVRNLAVRRTGEFGLLVVPIGLCLLASALHYYSLIPRLTLFFLPLVLLVVFTGMEQLLAHRLMRYVIAAGFGVTLLNQLHRYEIMRPFQADYAEVRKGLEFIHQHQQPNEAVLVTPSVQPVVRYYAHDHQPPLVLPNVQFLPSLSGRLRKQPSRRAWLVSDVESSSLADSVVAQGATIVLRHDFYNGYVLLTKLDEPAAR